MRAKLVKLFTKKSSVVITLLIVVNILLFGAAALGFFQIGPFGKKELSKAEAFSPEIEGIKEVNNEEQKVSLYTQLIKRVGPVQAQEELYSSGLPFDGAAHLLNHTVGDWLYDTHGAKGMIYCRDYFLSSCYHGFLIRSIADHGMTQLSNVMDECWRVGAATAMQCSHAIGHGLLAWENYKNLPEALADCDTVSTISKDFFVYSCYDGVFMENNWALHNNGKPSPDRWIKLDDPTYPCYDDRIAEKYRKACWSNQPQMMYKDIFPGDINRVAKECEKVENKEYQATCFDSLARQIHPLVGNDIQKAFIYCDKMPVGWKNACVISLAISFFSVGDRDIPFTLCAMLPEDAPLACYKEIQQKFDAYVFDLSERLMLCRAIPKEYQTDVCR